MGSPHPPKFSSILEMLQEILWSLQEKKNILIAHSQRFLLDDIFLHEAQVMYYVGHIYSNVFNPCSYVLREMFRN